MEYDEDVLRKAAREGFSPTEQAELGDLLAHSGVLQKALGDILNGAYEANTLLQIDDVNNVAQVAQKKGLLLGIIGTVEALYGMAEEVKS